MHRMQARREEAMLDSTLHEPLAQTVRASANASPGLDDDDGMRKCTATAAELPGGGQVLRTRPAVRRRRGVAIARNRRQGRKSDMNNAQPLPDIRIENSRGACANCASRAACLPAGLGSAKLERLEALGVRPHRILRDSYLYRAGTELRWLYAIRSGSLKSCVLDKDGHEQIIGFHLAPELLGMDAINTGEHVCNAIALEDSEVCKIPFSDLQQLSREIPTLGRNLDRMISHEIGRGYGVMLLLGSMHADERVASFLLSLSRRFLARGYSPSQFVLRMTRRDIGSYLGMKLETVSRMFSRFQREGMVAVERKEIRLIDLEKLRALVHGADPHRGGLPAHETAAVVMNKLPSRMPAGHAAAAPL
jgi:CRP/FNR family transcriptional regulator, anaerobic regulatory protein